MLPKSFAPPLRIRLDGTILKSAPNPHETPIFPIYRSIYSGLEDQNRLEATYLSPKIGDRWRLSRVDSHSHRKPIALPPRAGPTHMNWINSPPEHVARGGGGLAVIRNRSKVNQYRLAIWKITFVRLTEPLIQPIFDYKVQSSAGIRDCYELLRYCYVKL